MALTQHQINEFENRRVGFWDRVLGVADEQLLTGEQYIIQALQVISQQLAVIGQSGGLITNPLPAPLPQPVPIGSVAQTYALSGSSESILTAVNLVDLNQFVAANNQPFGNFTAPFTGTATILINLSAGGILSLIAQTVGASGVNTTAQLLDGATVATNQWQTIQIPITQGNLYLLQTSVGATVTLQITGRPQ